MLYVRAFALVLVLVPVLAPSTGHAEDLLDIYRAARSADPVLATADAVRAGVRENALQARAVLLPQVAAGFALNQTHTPGAAANDPFITDRNRSRALTTSLSQVVVDVSRLAQYRSTREQADAQDASYRASEQALVVRVASAYLGVLTATDALATTLANEDAFHQQVDQAEQRYRNGLSALADLEQSRAFYAAARTNTIGARTSLADAREALTELTGSLPGPLKTLRNDLPTALPRPADPQAWVDAALRDNPSLLAQQRLVAAADQAITAARAGHLPTLTAGIDVGRSAGWPTPISDADGRTVTTIGLQLNVPLFSGGAVDSRARQAYYQRDSARDELERQRRQVGRDTLNRYRSVVAGIDQIGATREAFDSAAKALGSIRVGRELGTHTQTDLLLAIQNLASAQSSYSVVRHRFVLDQLLLQQAAGAVGEADLAAVNALLE